MIYQSTSPADTIALAHKLARFAMVGDCYLLTGELGAGKSHFARAFIQALGTRETHIPSPTFSLVQTYDDTRLPVIHADLYRLKDPSELAALDLAPYFTHGVSLLEWPEVAAAALPTGALNIQFKVVGDNTREIIFTGPKAWDLRLQLALGQAQNMAPVVKDYDGFLAAHGWAGATYTPVSGDASYRRYWRVIKENRTAIMMDVPPVMQDGEPGYAGVIQPFIALNAWLHQAGVRVSEVYGVEADQALVLHEDFGSLSHYEASVQQAGERRVEAHWLQAAVDVLVRLHKAGPPPTDKRFDQAFVHRCVSMLTEWYLPRQQGRATTLDERAQWLRAWDGLLPVLTGAPWGAMLRDFHSPNALLLGPNPGPDQFGLIDYQDAINGPLAYDLVSCLYDARVPVPACVRAELLEYYILKTGVDAAAFTAQFYLLSLMRNSRILGVFVRLAERDNKPAYLEKIPILVPYIQEALQHPAAAPLRPWLAGVQ